MSKSKAVFESVNYHLSYPISVQEYGTLFSQWIKLAELVEDTIKLKDRKFIVWTLRFNTDDADGPCISCTVSVVKPVTVIGLRRFECIEDGVVATIDKIWVELNTYYRYSDAHAYDSEKLAVELARDLRRVD